MTKRIKWSLPNLKELASQYPYAKDFRKRFPGAYQTAWKNGWLDELHLITTTPADRGPRIWTYLKTQQEATKFNSRLEFAKKSSAAYHSALKHGWLDEFGLPKVKSKPANLKWDYRTTKKAAEKFTTRGAFQKHNQSAYQAAWRNGWLEEFFPPTS